MIDLKVKEIIDEIKPKIESILGGSTTLDDIEKYSDDLLVVICIMYAKSKIIINEKINDLEEVNKKISIENDNLALEIIKLKEKL